MQRRFWKVYCGDGVLDGRVGNEGRKGARELRLPQEGSKPRQLGEPESLTVAFRGSHHHGGTLLPLAYKELLTCTSGIKYNGTSVRGT